MSYFVLVAWVIQGAVGVVLLARWLAHGRPHAPTLLSHVALSVVALALWLGFMISGSVVWGWTALGLITVGNALGDRLLIARGRRLNGARGFVKDYAGAISAAVRRRTPGAVSFHALFAGVVYFGALIACVLASTG